MSVEPFAAGVWATALSGSAAIAAVLPLRAPLRRLFGAGIAYALWSAVPLAMLAWRCAPGAVGAGDAAGLVGVAQGMDGAAAAMSMADDPVALWMAALWMLGAAAMAATLWRQQRRYRRSLGRLSQGADDVLYAQHALHGPLVLGAWRPRVVVPMDFAPRYRAAQSELVLARECMHIARGDTRCNLLLAALRCVHWFDPLLHWAAARFRFDQELACDAAVLARHPGSRRSYAEAMLQTQLDAIALPVGCHWQAGRTLRHRIGMLQRPAVRGRRRRAGIVLATTTAVCGGVAAWPLQPLQASALAGSDIAPALSTAQARNTGPLAGTASALGVAPAGGQKRLPMAIAAAAGAASASAKRATTSATSLFMPPPAYPPDALREGVSGKLALLVSVDEAGTASDVQLLGHGSGNAALDQSAITTARQWRFVPAREHGRAVASRLKIPVTFESGIEPVDAPPGEPRHRTISGICWMRKQAMRASTPAISSSPMAKARPGACTAACS
ncbi:TonB family protein [Xanthomonas theicola]|uniref:TonB family protein n=1 Tax=Xanthomonas theicola TaxID=56464 RepID=UPI003620D587